MLNLFKSPSYSGKNVYRYIEQVITKGRRVLIVSPYIDRYYANFILSNSKGRKFYILSSSMEDSAKRLLTKGRFPKDAAYLSTLLVVAEAFLYLSRAYLPFLYLLPVAALSIAAMILLAIRKPMNINLRFPKEFVHAKLYVSESMAVHGSANLTYKGMHKNIEHVEVAYDEGEIKRLENQFWQLWNYS
ncbi:MAG: hypothetical protein KGH61_03160 [Candidatus Micrarchaeota archaeon]|nr:hypothetical protein [Candidatus Micrarchaeota archaeon]MDE1847922.1 hypothetical protein [Candidatus Micrarchaeota archaeon]MDE1864832.1 hypothetical protein [Candidatus Micrarchaeota archaeon]